MEEKSDNQRGREIEKKNRNEIIKREKEKEITTKIEMKIE